MRGYGLPRRVNRDCPSKAEVQYFGLSSRYGERFRHKTKVRRIWKRRARRLGKQECREQLENYSGVG